MPDDALPEAAAPEAAAPEGREQQRLEGDEQRPEGVPRGLSWALGGYIAAFLLSVVAAIGYVAVSGLDEAGDLSIVETALLQVPLWAGLAGAPLLASRRSGSGSLGRDFGLIVRRRDALIGLGLGLAAQVVLVPLIYILLRPLIEDQDVSEEARQLVGQAEGPLSALVLVVIVVILAPVVEELFYRGLLLRSIERRWGAGWAVGGSSVLFGVTHFQLIQLPALVAFGIVLGVLAVRTRRLGAPIFAHMAFNAVTVGVLLAGVL